ncbi:hypothetical protein [Streptomyces sp. NPDC002845]
MRDLLARPAEIQQLRPPTAEAPADHLDRGNRTDRITALVLSLLFDLTQQSARFSSGIAPWGQLSLYDTDDFAPFMAEGSVQRASGAFVRAAWTADLSHQLPRRNVVIEPDDNIRAALSGKKAPA